MFRGKNQYKMAASSPKKGGNERAQKALLAAAVGDNYV
jgi:hypothetical protein